MAAALIYRSWSLFGLVALFLLAAGSTMIHPGGSSFEIVKNPIGLWAGEIARAEKSILIATYKFSTNEALEPLLAARSRKVDVSLLIDGKEASKAQNLIEKAGKSGINIYIWNTGTLGELHVKFTVIDDQTLILGSFNLSKAAANTNTESILITHEPTLVRKAAFEFGKLIARDGVLP